MTLACKGIPGVKENALKVHLASDSDEVGEGGAAEQR